MRKSIATAAVTGCLLLAGLGATTWPTTHEATPEPTALRLEQQEASQRFAIKFCYAQYRSQTDVSRCLLRNIRS
jgi:hypothetical protein